MVEVAGHDKNKSKEIDHNESIARKTSNNRNMQEEQRSKEGLTTGRTTYESLDEEEDEGLTRSKEVFTFPLLQNSPKVLYRDAALLQENLDSWTHNNSRE